MTDKNTSNAVRQGIFSETLRNSIMVILTLIFVFLYAAAFSGKLDPLKDNTMILRFEPIIFLLIGYYFGWFPSHRNEQVLKDEIARQTQKADAVQYAKEKAQQDCEMLEEKIKNVKTALKTIAPPKTADAPNVQSKAVTAALRILDS